jgi:alpha-mannosidase
MPAASFVHAAGATVLLDHVTEYELVDGREIALTVLRSTGLISRNDNPFREDPAGPEVPVPDAQLVGPWTFTFAILPHAGSWATAGVLAAAEAYRHPFLTALGTGPPAGPDRTPPTPGLTIDGDGVVLSALRRRDGWLEARVVALTDRPTVARLGGRPIRDAHDVDLQGRRLGDLGADARGLAIPLGPWEIRTIRFAAG